MREHGVLDRLLLVYEESRRRILGSGRFDPQVLHRAADLTRNFIGEYHERQEEEHVFPRFEAGGRHVELVRVLRAQHEAGRKITDDLARRTASTSRPGPPKDLVAPIDALVRMYRPHAAREDTVLFPALREITTPAELAELGEQFEETEHQRFGKGGFERIVSEVASLERTLGIHDLAEFTPTA